MPAEVKSLIEQQTQTELFEKIGAICTAVNTVISAKELLEISLKKTMDLFGAKRGSIFILDSKRKELTLKIAQGLKKEEEDKLKKHMGEGIVGKVAELKQPIVVDDIAKESRFGNLKPRRSYATASFICAPLMIKDQLIGVINITDKESGNRFTKYDLQLLDFLTSQIALNYRRVELYNKFKNIVQETKDLKQKLGQSDQETEHLKKQIVIHEKLATIGKLAGGIAHEFNNPLDGVMRYTNLCLDHTKDDEIVRGYLIEIKSGLKRMANIVKNLLACSRNEFPGRQMVNFKQALDHSIKGRKTELEHKNINLKTSVDKSIPMIPDFGLELILTNLLRNGIDAIKDDGQIHVNANFDDQVLTIAVRDTGIGISAKNIEQIFEPFYTTKDIEKGCGLGLTIIGEVVKSYNGKINVESKPNKGTTFTIALPINQ